MWISVIAFGLKKAEAHDLDYQGNTPVKSTRVTNVTGALYIIDQIILSVFGIS